MGTTDEEKVDLEQLKECFGPWKVPSDKDFAKLIAVATLSYRPGKGLTGGDPSTTSGEVAASEVTALCVSTRLDGGMTVTKDNGLSIQVEDDGGLAWANYMPGSSVLHSLTLKAPKDKSVLLDETGVSLQALAPLKVAADVSVEIDETHALQWADTKNISVKVDGKSVGVDSEKVYVRCKKGGGLKVDDKDGYLTIDIDAILEKKE